MPVITSTRRATYNEVVREMDRRGTVIETLEAEIHRLRGRDAPGRAEARREALEEAANVFDTYAGDQRASISKGWLRGRGVRDAEVRAEVWADAANDLRQAAAKIGKVE